MENNFNSISPVSLSTEGLLLIGIFAVVLFLIITIKVLDKKSRYKIFSLSLFWCLFLSFVFSPHGIDYNIYTYNAELTINHHKTFGRKDSVKIPLSVGWKKSAYFDYTGFQHLVYVGLTYINNIAKKVKFKGLGFQLWFYFTFFGVISIIFYRSERYLDKDISQFFLPVIVLTFHPIFSLYWLVYYWEDKLIFILIPLLVIYLIEKKQFSKASFIVGLSIGWNGILIFFAPAFLIYLYRIDKKNFIKYLILSLIGLIISIIPFFPESLSNWKNRAIRMDNYIPFWFSIYKLFPYSIYSPQFNNIITILLAVIFNLLYYFKRICIIDMVIISVCIVIMLGSFNYIARYIPVLFLIIYLTPQITKSDWLIFSLVLGLLFLININTKSYQTSFLQTLLFHIPFIYVLILYIKRRIKFPLPISWTDNETVKV